MLTGPTLDKLHALNLGGMARALAVQREQPTYGALGFEDRLGLLVDRELTDRENRRMERYLKAAKLRVAAAIEDVDFRTPRGLDRATLLDLAAARWVGAHQQVLITGPTGVGKTYLACALAAAAIRAVHTALYLRVSRLLAELATARADGRLPRLMAAWARVDVLVLDDFALQPLTDAQTADLLEVIKDRAGCAPRSSRASSRSPSGTRAWASRRSPTPSSTGCSMAPIASSSGASLRRAERPQRIARQGPPRRQRRAADAPPSGAAPAVPHYPRNHREEVSIRG